MIKKMLVKYMGYWQKVTLRCLLDIGLVLSCGLTDQTQMGFIYYHPTRRTRAMSIHLDGTILVNKEFIIGHKEPFLQGTTGKITRFARLISLSHQGLPHFPRFGGRPHNNTGFYNSQQCLYQHWLTKCF